MIFGKIEYLNLLPFHTFMKRYISSSQQTMSMRYNGGVPSNINNKFLSKKVDAAFISSVKAKKHKYINLGIIAKKEVLSVLVIPNTDDKNDFESATSNVLARVLDVKGEVIIGDKALKYYLQNKPNIDLAKEWNIKYNLPFVFAVLCYHKDKNLYKNIEKKFLKQKVKIPQYILKQASKKTDISEKDILNYLNYISYSLDAKAKKGLKLFQRLII
ncbi:MAG: MqnA/MqnD/SBP family protein [Campylobacterota bacterium]|nr:MqnA/MqnD/SBP family protein [Campylobacterota bacterium]